jgi:PilZ domain
MQQALAECRVYERHSCQVPASCQPAAANEMRWAAIIEDVSLGGVRLRLRRRFEPNSGLAIELPAIDGHDAERVYAKVMRVERDSDGTYLLGCKFMSELSEEELHRLVFSAPAQDEPEPILGVLAEETLSAPPAEEAPAYQAPDEEAPQRTVVPGVRLWIGVGEGEVIHCRVKRFHAPGSWPLAPGKALNLRGVARNGSRLEHPFEVVDCSPEGEGWLLQVRAVDPLLGEEVLAAFGR